MKSAMKMASILHQWHLSIITVGPQQSWLRAEQEDVVYLQAAAGTVVGKLQCAVVVQHLLPQEGYLLRRVHEQRG